MSFEVSSELVTKSCPDTQHHPCPRIFEPLLVTFWQFTITSGNWEAVILPPVHCLSIPYTHRLLLCTAWTHPTHTDSSNSVLDSDGLLLLTSWFSLFSSILEHLSLFWGQCFLLSYIWWKHSSEPSSPTLILGWRRTQAKPTVVMDPGVRVSFKLNQNWNLIVQGSWYTHTPCV